MVSTVLFFIVLVVVLAGLLVAIAAVAAAWLDDGAPARLRRRFEQHVREAEREIGAIGRRTQEAILAEAWRRARNKRPGA
jgi:hypothetical protein